jgi:hypothetical protein
MRRGPVTPRIVELLRGSPVKACEDGGAAAARAGGGGEPGAPEGTGEAASGRDPELGPGAAEPSGDAAERLEALAYAEATDFIERLGAAGSAVGVVRALERRLEDG